MNLEQFTFIAGKRNHEGTINNLQIMKNQLRIFLKKIYIFTIFCFNIPSDMILEAIVMVLLKICAYTELSTTVYRKLNV